jgi:hypothetical protein
MPHVRESPAFPWGTFRHVTLFVTSVSGLRPKRTLACLGAAQNLGCHCTVIVRFVEAVILAFVASVPVTLNV